MHLPVVREIMGGPVNDLDRRITGAILAVVSSLVLVVILDTFVAGTITWWWAGGLVFGATVAASLAQNPRS